MVEMHKDYDFYSMELFDKACKQCTYSVKCTCDSTPSIACRNDDMIRHYRGIPPHRLFGGNTMKLLLHTLLTPKMQDECPRNERYRECL